MKTESYGGRDIVWLRGYVEEIVSRTQDLQEIEVRYGEEKSLAFNFVKLTGEVSEGDEVVVNATARALGLGSGGYDFVAQVIKSLGPLGLDGNVAGQRKTDVPRGKGQPRESSAASQATCPNGITMPIPNGVMTAGFAGREQGHIMKLRYTPLQFRCLAVEEEASGRRDALQRPDLEGMPVIVGELHSQVAPAVAGIWCRLRGRRITPRVTYIMTDGGALPLAISKTVAFLKERGLVGTTITCGHAFGGDLEAINVYSALIAAKHVSKADVAVVCIGPGIVGTGTAFGTTAISQGEAINAAFALGGKPIAVPRIGFADTRTRHYGLSHHTVTVLKEVVYPPCIVGLPRISRPSLDTVFETIRREGLYRKHLFIMGNGVLGTRLLQDMGFELQSMGRSYEQEPLLFEAAAACGDVAGVLALAARRRRRDNEGGITNELFPSWR
ncbi:MAG TPA: DUF3866 family protein [Clostridia bacterium]|nr:DUF3866 family protein [Clostridia bacterium]